MIIFVTVNLNHTVTSPKLPLRTALTTSHVILVYFVVWLQLVFSDELPQNVGPGEHVYVVVDGVAYRLVLSSSDDEDQQKMPEVSCIHVSC